MKNGIQSVAFYQIPYIYGNRHIVNVAHHRNSNKEKRLDSGADYQCKSLNI